MLKNLFMPTRILALNRLGTKRAAAVVADGREILSSIVGVAN